MSRLKSIALAASLATGLSLATGAAHAVTISHGADDVTIQQTFDISANGTIGSVGVMGVQVLTRGRFNIETFGNAIHAQLRMFNDENMNGKIDATEKYIGGDVTGCAFWLSCTLTGAGTNASLLGRWLNVGYYLFAVGDARLTIAEARSGVNELNRTNGGLNLTGLVTAQLSTKGIGEGAGTAQTYTPVVPLPAGGVLLLTGLAALGLGRRFKKAA